MHRPTGTLARNNSKTTKQFMKTTDKQVIGTSFFGTTIKASVFMLKNVLGEPSFEQNDGKDKVNYEWIMETDSGDVFTVYDWKECEPLDEHELVMFHIGGYSESSTWQAQKEITNAIKTQ